VGEPTYRVVEAAVNGEVLRTIAEGKSEKNAWAIADMAVIRRGVEHSIFRVEPEREAHRGEAQR